MRFMTRNFAQDTETIPPKRFLRKRLFRKRRTQTVRFIGRFIDKQTFFSPNNVKKFKFGPEF